MRYAASDTMVDRYGSRNFPPVPSEIITVTAAFLELDATGINIRQSAVALQPTVARDEHISALYTNTVGDFQASFPSLHELAEAAPELSDLQGMQRWCVRKLMHERHRTLGAHVTARVLEDGQFIDSMVYPRSIGEDLPLVIRDAVISQQPLIDKIIEMGLLSEEETQQFKDATRPLYQRQEAAADIAVVALSSFLPKPEEFRKIMTALPPSASMPPGGNRAARRRQARDKRRPGR